MSKMKHLDITGREIGIKGLVVYASPDRRVRPTLRYGMVTALRFSKEENPTLKLRILKAISRVVWSPVRREVVIYSNRVLLVDRVQVPPIVLRVLEDLWNDPENSV